MPDVFDELSRELIQRMWPAAAPPPRDELIAAVADALETCVAEERHRCVEICRERAALWRRTPLAHFDAPPARDEARARANEAAYLADFIESSHLIAEGSAADASRL